MSTQLVTHTIIAQGPQVPPHMVTSSYFCNIWGAKENKQAQNNKKQNQPDPSALK